MPRFVTGFPLMDYYDLRQVALVGLVAYVVYALYQRRTRSSVKDIPGPPNPSWIHGKVGSRVSSPSLLGAISKATPGIGWPKMQVS